MQLFSANYLPLLCLLHTCVHTSQTMPRHPPRVGGGRPGSIRKE